MTSVPSRGPAPLDEGIRARAFGAVVETAEVVDVALRRDQEVLARLREICATLAGCEEAVLQDRALFRVGRRRFAIFNGTSSPARSRWDGAGRSIHFLSDPIEREALLQDGRFTRSPHHGDRGWLAIRVESDDVDWTELAELLETAHAQVASRQ